MKKIKLVFDPKVNWTNELVHFQNYIRDKTRYGRAKYIRDKYAKVFGDFEYLGTHAEILAMKIEYEYNYRALAQNNIPMSTRFLNNYNAVKDLPLKGGEVTQQHYDRFDGNSQSLYRILLTTTTSEGDFMANKETAAKTAKVEKGPSIRVTACDLIVQEKFTNNEIIAKVKELHVGSGISPACLAWYRNKLNKGAFADYKQPDEPYKAIREKKAEEKVDTIDKAEKAEKKVAKKVVKTEEVKATKKIRKA